MWDACGVVRWCAGVAENLLLIRLAVLFRPRVVTGRQELHQLKKGCMSQWGLWAQWYPDLEWGCTHLVKQYSLLAQQLYL